MRVTNIRVVSSSSAIEDDYDGKLIFHPPEWKSEFFIRYPFFPFNFRRSFPRLNKMISNRNSSTPDPGKMDITEQPVLF
jgi:hypothetical protein